jgi:acyl dehydratase
MTSNASATHNELQQHDNEIVFLDDIEVGMEYVSEPRTITASDIRRFAELTGDFNPLHVDEEWVRKNTDFPGIIAHGLLLLSVGNALKTPGLDDMQILAYLNVDRNMVHHILPDDTVRMRNVIAEVRRSKSRPGNGIVKVDVSLVNQHDEIIQSGADTYLVGARS